MQRKKILMKKIVAALMLSSFALQIVPECGAAAQPIKVELRAPLKNEVAIDDADDLTSPNKRTNVLFLVEATAAMSFTPKGVIPVVAMGDFDYGVESETADWA
ncbi:MAG: hypothetical protein LBQ58_11960, partial [Synergistaceae bacterium]|nr:hypothetical protein [Synergistaceae bacterium]